MDGAKPSPRTGHRCPYGHPRCGLHKLRPFGRSSQWFCSRCCELLAIVRVRSLAGVEVEELGGIIAAQAADDSEAVAAG